MKSRAFFSVLLVFQISWPMPSNGQVFDEKFEHWPLDLSINGTIVILNQVADPRLIPELSLRFSSQESSKVPPSQPKTPPLVIATVLSGELPPPEQRSEWLTQQGLARESTFFQLNQPQWSKIDEALKSSPLVVLSVQGVGLQTDFSTLKSLRTRLKKHLENKGILVATGSAAKLLSAKVVTGNHSYGTLQDGLGLVPDSLIETVFQEKTDQRRVRSALAAHPRLVGIGIRANTCLVLRGRKLFTVKTGEAKIMLAANERQPQRNQVIGSKIPRSHRLDLSRNLVDLTEWRRDAIDRTLSPFPPAKPTAPFVENGALVIVGGGGMPENLMEKMINLAGGKENAKMVYVPCSETKEIKGEPRTVKMWKNMGVRSANFIHTKDRTRANQDKDFLAPLKEATGIWFGGGRQWNFSDSYYGTQAHRLMKDVLKRGGVIGGSSAGASIQARYLARATPIGNFQIMAPGYERGGLGFISGVAIDQHFSQRGRQKDMTQLMARHPQLLGIGLDEATAIIVQKEKATVVGKGRVHFYDRNQPVFPGKPDYIALPEGSVFDLRGRKILVETQPQPQKPSKEKTSPDKPG